MPEGPDRRLLVLCTLFGAALVTANLVASKIVVIGGLVVPAGVLLYSITFLVTDTVSEVYGRRAATSLIWTGLWVSLLILTLVQVARVLPPAPFYADQAAFDAVFGMTPRIVVASMIAYALSQWHDVWAFHWWRARTGGRHLWLRNNASTLVSQGIDTVVFIAVAFGGLVPVAALSGMMVGQYLIKIGIALADTPLCYLAVRWARRTATAAH